MLQGKKVLIGICGSIAAYKSAFLTRLLIKAGAEVRVIMTTSARSFITPLTLSTLSRNPVLSDLDSDGEWNNHVELGLWADVFLIAPGSANTMAKMAHGICDNLLTATYLSAKCPVIIAPAMDLDMYRHPSTVKNMEILRSYGNTIIDAGEGELASGLTGVGRMAEPDHIIGFLESSLKKKSRFVNKTVMITAGPTWEPIDPVRFIANHSTGKMGYALAEQFAGEGARVILISGPTHLQVRSTAIQRIEVSTGEEMYKACLQYSDSSSIVILAAAVADYRPAHVADQKIKKQENNLSLELVKTTDIAASLGKQKKEGQVIVGFALETENGEAHAREKLVKKNFDLIVLNSLSDPGAGFGYDTNKVSILDKQNNIRHFELNDKQQVAGDIADAIYELRQ